MSDLTLRLIRSRFATNTSKTVDLATLRALRSDALLDDGRFDLQEQQAIADLSRDCFVTAGAKRESRNLVGVQVEGRLTAPLTSRTGALDAELATLEFDLRDNQETIDRLMGDIASRRDALKSEVEGAKRRSLLWAWIGGVGGAYGVYTSLEDAERADARLTSLNGELADAQQRKVSLQQKHAAFVALKDRAQPTLDRLAEEELRLRAVPAPRAPAHLRNAVSAVERFRTAAAQAEIDRARLEVMRPLFQSGHAVRELGQQLIGRLEATLSRANQLLEVTRAEALESLRALLSPNPGSAMVSVFEGRLRSRARAVVDEAVTRLLGSEPRNATTTALGRYFTDSLMKALNVR